MKNKRGFTLLLVLTITGHLWGCAPAATTSTAEIRAEETSSPAAETTAASQESSEQADASSEKTLVKSREDIPAEYQWDLTDIFASQEAFDQTALEAEAKVGKLGQWSGKLDSVESVKAFLDAKEDAQIPYQKIQAYIFLMDTQQNGNTKSAELGETSNRLYQLIVENTAFFNAEMSQLPDSLWDDILSSEELKPYSWELTCLNAERTHMLTEEQELLLFPLRKNIKGAEDLYNKLTNIDMEYDTVTDQEGHEVVVTDLVLSSILAENPDQEFRKECTEIYNNTYGKYRNILAQNMDNFIQAEVSLARFQNYKDAKEAHMSSAHVSPEVYTNLLAAVNSNLESHHREYALRKEIMGLKALYNSDLSYPLSQTQLSFPYETAKEHVLHAVAPLGTDYQKRMEKAFSECWIDVYPTENKTQGASSFSYPSGHPYVLLNQTDDYESMSILAHELGHAMHTDYSSEEQSSFFNENATSFTSEVASTANELLLADYMFANAKTKDEKLFYLTNELSLLSSSFFGQAMYAEFEEAMYQCVEEGGTLTPDFLEETYRDISSKYSGSGVEPMESSKYRWARVPHFFYRHYVYQYATSIAASCTITQRIQAGEPGAVEAYLEFLKAGDSASGADLLKLTGVDITSEHFADDLIDRYNKIIDEIEKLYNE